MTALRKLKEKTSVAPQYLEQLHVYSGHSRDPRGFSVTLVYFALISEQAVSTHIDTVDDAQWIDLDKIARLAQLYKVKENADIVHFERNLSV